MSKKGDLHWRAASEAKVLTSFNSVSVITEKNQDRVWSVACCSGCIWDSDPEPLCSPSHTGTCFSLPHDDRCSFKDFWSRQGQEKWVVIRLLLLIRKVFLFGSRLHVTFWSKEKDELLHVLILAFILPHPADSDAHSTTSSASPAQSPCYSNQSDEGSDTEMSAGSSRTPVFSFLDLTYWKR